MSSVLPVYNPDIITSDPFIRGEGCYLYGASGKRYLDFGSGVAVSSLGHQHPALIKTLQEQATKLWHCSNWYHIPPQEAAAKALTDNTFADYVFFCNSGAEANECAIKIARRRYIAQGKYRIITTKKSFHGRTLTEVSSKNDYSFGPVIPSFDYVNYGSIEYIERSLTNESTAILVEPIQGEGGIHPATLKYLKDLRKFANEHSLTLIFDEIQTGIGRTGKLFAYEWAEIEPDIVTSAKGLGSGFPVGACLVSENSLTNFNKGMHGSTYGGNHLATSIVKTIIDIVTKPGFLHGVDVNARSLWYKLVKLVEKYPSIFPTVRGAGLMLGLKCVEENITVARQIAEKGLLVIPAGDNVIRLLPPLIIEEQHIIEAINILTDYAINQTKN